MLGVTPLVGLIGWAMWRAGERIAGAGTAQPFAKKFKALSWSMLSNTVGSMPAIASTL